ncbi:transcriptional regulator FtsR [Micromonospora profundi]|uniref:MerR family transcriptional regulator n=1 Tax=Micromonospora profundi TaxID=1420889 RepID=A0AAJ6I103_9ACTN|nr:MULTISPECIES: MerR family transcriptional regulator [Micromonospora]KOX02790.1 MerR family transcriptional regulator [Micromonospora sp. NRRL B-16802]WLS48835.1 MerR family transcriptional regulator [Micromonospora profundi]
MSIGEVLGQLRVDFPDTTISKLRFLEAEGLVEPQRTAAGYRKYSWDDVARLRFVLSAQRDRYLPLRVIREQLAEWDSSGEQPGRSRPSLVAVGPDGAVPGRESAEPAESSQVRLGRADLVARSGIDDSTLVELERLGVLVSDPPGWYDGDALIIASAVAGLAAYGLEPRHLRGYRSAADREVGLFAQLVAPLARQSDPAARARAAETARELVALSEQLHAALVRVGLRSTLGR